MLDAGEGWTHVRFLLRPSGEAQPGDRARIEIVGAEGEVFLAVERPLTFSGVYLNGGESCGPWCASSRTSRLYPQSVSGKECPPKVCASQVNVSVRFEPKLGARVKFCRNDVCGETENAIERRPEYVEGGLRGVVSTGGGERYSAIVYLETPEPAVLADGDRYSASIIDSRTGAITKSFQTIVTYATEAAADPGCDPYPCRSASISFE